MKDRAIRWSEQTKLVVSLLLVIFFVYLLFRFSVILPPVILAIILAYIVSPLVNAFQKQLKIKRGLATLLGYLIILAILITLPVGLIPMLANQVKDLNVDIQILITQAETLLGHQYVVFGQVIDGAAVFHQLVLGLQGLINPVMGQTVLLAAEVISSVVWVIFIFVVSFYLVKDGDALRKWLEGLPPPDYREDFIHLRNEISQIWSAFFRGQLVLSMVVTIIFTVTGLIIGLPFALAMGLLAGLLEFLPSIGHGIWLICASILTLVIGSTWIPIPNWIFTLIIVGLHIVFQQFDLNYLIPRIIGHRVHLPPLVVIFGIVGGAVFAGVLGIPLAAPTIASARVIGRYIYANLFDLNPFPETVAPPLPPPNPQWWRPESKKETITPYE